MTIPKDLIRSEAETWAGVTVGPHRFNGIEFLLGKAEIGHLHGSSLLDIAFSKPVRDVLVREGIAQPHHVAPETGWISFYLRQPADVDTALWLLRVSYLRHALLLSRKGQPIADLDLPDAVRKLALPHTLLIIFRDLMARSITKGSQDGE
jgi:hypothetical protein